MVAKSLVKDLPMVFHRRSGIDVTGCANLPGDLLQGNLFGKVALAPVVKVIHRGSALVRGLLLFLVGLFDGDIKRPLLATGRKKQQTAEGSTEGKGFE